MPKKSIKDKDYLKAFAGRLSYLRLIANLTQAELAEKAGISIEHLSKLERGASGPSFGVICTLANALETDPANLFLFSGRSRNYESINPANDSSYLQWSDYVSGIGEMEFDYKSKSYIFSTSLSALLGCDILKDNPKIEHLLSAHVHPESRQDAAKAFKELSQGKGFRKQQWLMLRKDGSERDVFVTSAIDRDEKGHPSKGTANFIDVTELDRLDTFRQENQQKLEETIKERTGELDKVIKQLKTEINIRKKNEDNLARSERNLILALTAARGGAFHFDVLKDRLVWDARSFVIYGFEPEEFEGNYNAWARRVHPEDLPKAEKDFLKTLDSTSEDSFDIEYRIIRSAGEIRHVTAQGYVIRNGDGKAAYVSGVHFDITERRLAEKRNEAISRLKDKLLFPGTIEDQLKIITDGVADVFEALIVKIWLVRKGKKCESDCLQRHRRTNCHLKRKCLHLVSRSSRSTLPDIVSHNRIPLGKSAIGLIAIGKFRKYVCNTISEESWMIDSEWAKAHGLVSFAGYRIISAAGDTVGVLALFGRQPILEDMDILLEDITRTTSNVVQRCLVEEELNESKQAAEAASRAKSAFLAAISHELRTPMNAILGYTQLMRRDGELKDSQKRYLNTISRSGEHLLGMINDLLELTRIESGKIDYTPNVFDYHTLVNGLETLFLPQTEEKGLRLGFITDRDVPRFVKTDEGKLRQILINLISNAIKYTDRGRIVIHSECKPLNPIDNSLWVTVRVQDSGRGIEPEYLGTIFRPFERFENSEYPSVGLGLGLSISKDYARYIGGEISVDSKPGEGSVFCLHFPVIVSELNESKTVKELHKVKSIKPGQKTPLVLIVSNYRQDREILCSLLIETGFEVHTATDGVEAITAFNEWQPDVIVMEKYMPIMNALEATSLIKSAPEGKATPVLIITGQISEDERSIYTECGASGLIAKPFEENQILHELARTLNIEYIYESEELTNKPVYSVTLPIQVKELPREIIREMIEALEIGDMTKMSEILNGIRMNDPELADQLGALADRYEYDTLFKILGGAD